MRWLTNRGVAAIVVVLSLAALISASSPLSEFRASVASPDSLPPDNSVRLAANAAAEGLHSRSACTHRNTRRTARHCRRPHRACRIATPDRSPAGNRRRGWASTTTGRRDSLRDWALLGSKRRRCPLPRHLLAEAAGGTWSTGSDQPPARNAGTARGSGPADANVDYLDAGALDAEFVTTARTDFVRVGIAVGLVNLVLLAAFLRAIIAPLYLLACSLLSVGAAMGLTTLLFERGAGYEGLIFYAPFAAAVLLISLGSDYNIFTVGRIWDEARHLPLREAVSIGLARSARPVIIAGVTLATSFAFVGLIPVAPFQQLAFAVAVGVLIDTFLVRSLLVPAMLVLVGRISGWPGRRFATARTTRLTREDVELNPKSAQLQPRLPPRIL